MQGNDHEDPSDSLDKKRILNRLKRLEGQVRGLQTMIESDKECEDVLTQIMAVKSALNQVGLHVIGHSMKRCLAKNTGGDPNVMIDEAIALFVRYSACVK